MFLKSKLQNTIFFLISLALISACQSSPQHVPSLSIKFALIGNVHPASPFRPYNPDLKKLVNQVNQENPLFTLHTGNIIYGGATYMGIRKSDITKQFDALKRYFSGFRSEYYLVMGEKDFYNDSPELCTDFQGKNNYYSFNYAALHFIILDTCQQKGELNSSQLEWLQEDLKTNKNAQAILIFSYNPFFTPKKYQHSSYSPLKNAIKLHTIFSQYPVMACFSAAIPDNFTIEKDGIQYINRSCYPLYKQKLYKKYIYYIVEFSQNSLYVQGKQIQE